MDYFLGRNFWSLFATLFVSAFNDNVFKNALVVLVAYRGVAVWGLEPGAVTALAGGLFMLPYFLFSPLAGQIADRFDKARVIRVTKLVEIPVMMLAAYGFLTESYGFLLGVLFLGGVQATFFGPVKYGVIPEVASDLTRANALVEAGTFLAILCGTILGGALASLDDPAWLAGGLIAIAFVGWVVSLPMRAAAPTETMPIRLNPGPGWRDLWRVAARERALWWAVIAVSWFWFVGAALLGVLPAFGRETLGVDASVVTFFLSLFTIGVGLGSLVGERVARGDRRRLIVPLGGAGLSVSALGLAVFTAAHVRPASPIGTSTFLGSANGVGLALAFLLLAFSGGLFILPLYTALQARSRPTERARVIAANNVSNAVFMVAASLGLIAARAGGVGHAGVFLGLGLANAAVLALVRRRAPELG